MIILSKNKSLEADAGKAISVRFEENFTLLQLFSFFLSFGLPLSSLIPLRSASFRDLRRSYVLLHISLPKSSSYL